MKARINLSIVGNQPELGEFLKLCQYIQSFGAYGMSRCVNVVTDGDGSGRLSFFGDNDEELPNIPLDTLHKIEEQRGEFNVDIGE